MEDAAVALAQSSAVYLALGERAERAREMLQRCDAFFDSVAPESYVQEKRTMFPRKLERMPNSQRNVLQFFEQGRERPPVVSDDLDALARALLADLHHVARRLLLALGDVAGLSSGQVEELLDPAEWVLNAVRYPGMPGKNGSLRFPAHRDWGVLTLYPAVGGPGLEAQFGVEWQRIEVPPGCMLVYAGQTFTQVSGGRVPALPHRVVQVSEADRSALIYYVDAARGMRLPDGRTVGDFIDGNLRRIGQIA
jgi:isopenicillin N synthase-like dioxygenase